MGDSASKLLAPQLFHGTSTLFLESIVRNGLGACDPIKEWRVLEFAKEILPLVETRLGHHDNYNHRIGSFRRMVEQRAGPMNFQHGETYLSPAPLTAVRYASNKRYGSELLSYSLNFLEGLLHEEVEGVRDRLYQRFPRIFELLDVSPAPVLISVKDIPVEHLAAEDGTDAAPTLKRLVRSKKEPAELNHDALQQANFRLRAVVPAANLSAWLINVTQWHSFQPKFTIYPLSLEGEVG